jgi:hypothetical protein
MGIRRFTRLWFGPFVFVGILSAQTPSKVDFAKDVLPILRQNCVPCHGPLQQNSGLRLDRKSSVINRRGVVPGSSENSFLFHRISGTAFGIQMPPTGSAARRTNQHNQDVDRPGRRLARFARQRSGVASLESKGRGYGWGVACGRPGGLYEIRGGGSETSQRARA